MAKRFHERLGRLFLLERAAKEHVGLLERSPLQPLVFDQDTSSWVTKEPQEPAVNADRLVVATFNTWFDDHFLERRVEALMEILRKNDADIIGLQEITRESLEIITCQPWIRDGYCISDVDGSTFEDYGVVILSRIPIHRLTVSTLPGPMQRRIVIAEFSVNGEILNVVPVHLESYRSSGEVRVAQLHAIFQLLKEASHSLIMGDFNFDSSWPENDFLDSAYLDLWDHLRPDEPGYTEDTDINRMRALVKRKSKHVRFDRILLRSQVPGWHASDIDLLGTAPISPHLPLVFPSDHFGLVGSLDWRKDDHRQG